MQPPFDRFYIDAHKHHLPYIEIATALKLSTSRVYHKRNGNNSEQCKKTIIILLFGTFLLVFQ